MNMIFWTPLIISFASTLGLGLLFSYNKRLILSGLGFSLFINAYSLQYYPLINALLSKARLFSTEVVDSEPDQTFYLSHHFYSVTGNIIWANSNFNHIEGCFRAAMAVNVAVSCVLGRVGLSEIFFTILMGTFGYELNRRICTNFGDDAFGSMYIFTFGGFMGLAMGMILRLRDKKDITMNNKLLKANMHTSTLSLLGAAILMLTLPFLAWWHHKSYFSNNSLTYNPVFCLILSSSGGLISSISAPLLSGRNPTVRDFIHGLIAGMIIGGASSYFTGNIAYCIGIGFSGGLIQSLI